MMTSLKASFSENPNSSWLILNTTPDTSVPPLGSWRLPAPHDSWTNWMGAISWKIPNYKWENFRGIPI